MQMETKKTEVIILISDKIDFKPKTVIRDNEGHFIMIKRSIHLEDLTVVNIYAPNIRILLNHREQILTELKGEIDTKNNSKALQYSLSSVDRLSWQKINKKNSRLD